MTRRSGLSLMLSGVGVLSFTLASCTSAPVPQPLTRPSSRSLEAVAAELATLHVSGYVLLADGAFEYASLEKARADETPPKGILRLETRRLNRHTPDDVQRAGDGYRWGSPVVWRQAVKDHGDTVEVDTLHAEGRPESRGHQGRGADYLFALRTFVRKEDLVPVVVSPVELRFEDGTRIRFLPGVAVGVPYESGVGRRAVSVQQMHFAAEVPDDALALGYTPQSQVDHPTRSAGMLAADAGLWLDGQEWAKGSEIRIRELREPTHVVKDGDQVLVELRASGLELTLRTSASSLVEPYEPVTERPVLTPNYETPPRWYYRIPEGTSVFWPDGKPAGRVRQYFTYATETPPDDGRVCLLLTEMMSNERLCFRLQDIEVIDRGR